MMASKNKKIERLFVAPHMDDGAIAFSGTLLSERDELAMAAHTVVATVFSESNYTKHGLGDSRTVTPIRQGEEQSTMESIGVDTLFMGFPEAPLRGYTISDPLDYPKQFNPEFDTGTVEKIARKLDEIFGDYDEVLLPLALGEPTHVDHRIVRKASLQAWANHPDLSVRIYEDIPYIEQKYLDLISSLDGAELIETPIDLDKKLELIRNYRSQPIDAWESIIRHKAGQPPVERTWTIRDISVPDNFKM